jgi:hypothetical protein
MAHQHKHDAEALFANDEQLKQHAALHAKYSKLASDAEIQKTSGESFFSFRVTSGERVGPTGGRGFM